MTAATIGPPQSPQAEDAVIGRMLADPKSIPVVVETRLRAGDFYRESTRVLFEALVDAFYADDAVDALSLASALHSKLGKGTRDEAIAWVTALAAGQQAFTGRVEDHAQLVRHESERRELLTATYKAQAEIMSDELAPAEIAGTLAQAATEVGTANVHRSEWMGFGDVGRRLIARQREMRAMRAAGLEPPMVLFGIAAIDAHTKGIKPGEMYFLAGEPGVGKSGVAWRCGLNFSEKQAKRPVDRQIATAIFSLEMGEEPSGERLGQGIANVDGGKLREGDLDDRAMQSLIVEWGRRKDLPLHFNFSSVLRASELRILAAEAVRRFNVGFIIIDHFRYFDMDKRPQNRLDEDEEKARFLKQRIAKELNVAVMCLGHTVKMDALVNQGRPNMSHLRGSGQIAAEADFLAFVYRPYRYAKQDDIDDGTVKRTDAELIYGKNRHSLDADSRFYFDPATLFVA